MPGSRAGLTIRRTTGEGGTPGTPAEPRVYIAGAYSVAEGAQRVYVAGTYTVHGPNKRQVYVAGAYSVELESEPAPPLDPPTADTISVSLVAPLVAQIAIIAFGEGALSRRLERRVFGSVGAWTQIGPTTTDLEQFLFFDDTVEPLGHYEWSIVAVNDDGETRSNVVDLEIPNTGRPDAPIISGVETTVETVSGFLSAYAHPESTPVLIREVWLERADGSYIVEPGVVLPDEDNFFAFDGVTENGFIGARDIDEELRASAPAIRVAYTLSTDEAEVDPGDEEVGGEITGFTFLDHWPLPTARAQFSINTAFPADYSTLYYLRSFSHHGLDSPILGSRAHLPSQPNGAFAFLKPGHSYVFTTGWIYRIGSKIRQQFRPIGVQVPRAPFSPFFKIGRSADQVLGHRVVGSFLVEWGEHEDCLLVPGTDRLGITQDGVTIIPLTEVVHDDEEELYTASYLLDSTELADGVWFLALQRETEAGLLPMRFVPIAIDNVEKGYQLVNESLLLSAGTIIGSAGEPDRWDEFETSHAVKTFRRIGDPNTGGRFIPNGQENPRTLDAIVVFQYASATGLGNYLQYSPDGASLVGPTAFADEMFKDLAGCYQATSIIGGFIYQFEGAPELNWALGNIGARGIGTLRTRSFNGDPAIAAAVLGLTHRRVWARNHKSDPWMAVRLRVSQTSIDPQNFLMQLSIHGPENEYEIGPQVTVIRNNQSIPCADPGVCVLTIGNRYPTVYIRSITVLPLAYGDCAIEPEPAIDPPEAINTPCPPTGVDVSWTEPYFVEP